MFADIVFLIVVGMLVLAAAQLYSAGEAGSPRTRTGTSTAAPPARPARRA